MGPSRRRDSQSSLSALKALGFLLMFLWRLESEECWMLGAVGRACGHLVFFLVCSDSPPIICILGEEIQTRAVSFTS